jgi:hypothetical protein
MSFTVTRAVSPTGFVYIAINPPPIPPATYEMVVGRCATLDEAIDLSGVEYDKCIAEGRNSGISWILERDGIDGSDYFDLDEEG